MKELPRTDDVLLSSTGGTWRVIENTFRQFSIWILYLAAKLPSTDFENFVLNDVCSRTPISDNFFVSSVSF